jgi:hypothetical protein
LVGEDVREGAGCFFGGEPGEVAFEVVFGGLGVEGEDEEC